MGKFCKLLCGLFQPFWWDGLGDGPLPAKISFDRLKIDLGVEVAGERDGARNYPKTNTLEPSDTEQRIADRIEAVARGAREDLHKQKQVYNDRLATLDVATCAARFSNIPAGIEAQYHSLVRTQKDLLHRLEEDVRSLDKELRDFKMHNRLERLAHYPASRRLAYGIFAILVLIESALNAYFFAKGNDFGLVGGFFQAVMFALFNVLLGFLLGRVCVPNVHRRNWIRRSAAAVSVLVMLCLAAVFNLWVAHYREAVALHPFEAAQTAVESFRGAPGGLTQFDSWMLLIVGCTWVGLAAFDAYRMDDPYPGYGILDRRWRSKEDEYVADVEDTHARIDTIREAGLKALDDALRELEFRRQQYHGLVEQRNGAVARCAEYLKHLEEVGNLLLASYRAANRRCRSDPAPVYFDHDWLRFPPQSAGPPESAGGPVSPMDLVGNATLGKFEEHRARVLTAAQNATDAFKALAELSTTRRGS